MSGEPDPAELEGEHQREADKLQERSEQLGQHVEDTSQDWERKRSDESVPGAPVPEDSGEEDEGEDESEDQEDQSEEEDEDRSEDGDDESDEDA